MNVSDSHQILGAEILLLPQVKTLLSSVVVVGEFCLNLQLFSYSNTSDKTNKQMETQKTQAENQPKPAMSSCRKMVKDDANFLEDVKDHIDEFINASMDDHKNCFNKTIKKMFGLSKAVAEKQQAEEAKGVESYLPLQTTLSD
ncbi:unnamed protein product [Brassica napus]|uniref:(rape) hypothetical protein n=1 Tax=Brassica napus TaxID=3708 RepID=A0A816LF26_BRANA|nr:unnamed protein product [Brassica napus]